MGVRPEDWSPVGNITLEPSADAVVRSAASSVVIAGPGAGKTELLAQRACYLLETGECPEPRMILAISFKKDAAKNLAERVRKRCGSALATRFHSFTYDAFAKSLVDRFRLGIPGHYRPSPDYQIQTDLKKMAALLRAFQVEFPRGAQVVADLALTEFSQRPPSIYGSGGSDIGERMVGQLWRYVTTTMSPSMVTFPMLSRLADLLLRENPLVLAAMRATFGHVFLDEFQDTTQIQYDLLVTAFRGSESIMTAVGDPKQRIMKWAGAKSEVLSHFRADFAAGEFNLLCNYRSVPRLVQIQHFFASHLSQGIPPAIWSKEDTQPEEACRVMLFDDPEDEARVVAGRIAELISDKGVRPREIAVLARLRVDMYGGQIMQALRDAGISARIESEFQDLLAEPIVDLAFSLFQLALGKKDPQLWQQVAGLIAQTHGGIDQGSSRMIILEEHLRGFLQELRREMELCSTEHHVDGMLRLFDMAVSLVGEQHIMALYPQYLQGDHLHEIKQKVASHLSSSLASSSDFGTAIKDFVGEDTVPILTIHKSKGLEYDTVFFVGLEDGAFFNFNREPGEETCAFFVALSRAIQRVYFTFSAVRNSGYRGGRKAESMEEIGTLYELLNQAGVDTEDFRTRRSRQ